MLVSLDQLDNPDFDPLVQMLNSSGLEAGAALVASQFKVENLIQPSLGGGYYMYKLVMFAEYSFALNFQWFIDHAQLQRRAGLDHPAFKHTHFERTGCRMMFC